MATTIISKAAPWRWQVRFLWPGSRNTCRERCWSQLPSRSAALREGQAREAHLLRIGEDAYLASNAPEPEPEPPEVPSLAPTVPTLAEFAPRFMSDHCAALKQKKSGIDSKRTHLKRHLIPALGALRLDQITTGVVAKLCGRLAKYSRKTVANVLVTLSKILHAAVDWDVIATMPCKIKIPKSRRAPPSFYELDRMRRLIDSAKAIDARTHSSSSGCTAGYGAPRSWASSGPT